MWDARNTKAYTAKESCHKYRAYASFFPDKHAKYLVGTRVCFGPDKNTEGRSLYPYDLKNRRVSIVVGEAAVRLCDLLLEKHPTSLKRGPLPDIHLPPILYFTGIPPKLVDNMGLQLHNLTCKWPRSKCSLQNFISQSGSRKRDFQILCSLSDKYSTPFLPHCATKLPPSLSKKHHSAQLDLRWQSDLTVAGGGVS
jgi:hypothetical protein